MLDAVSSQLLDCGIMQGNSAPAGGVAGAMACLAAPAVSHDPDATCPPGVTGGGATAALAGWEMASGRRWPPALAAAADMAPTGDAAAAALLGGMVTVPIRGLKSATPSGAAAGGAGEPAWQIASVVFIKCRDCRNCDGAEFPLGGCSACGCCMRLWACGPGAHKSDTEQMGMIRGMQHLSAAASAAGRRAPWRCRSRRCARGPR